ncbi:MAG: hypothetical protein ACJAZO_004998 [Myxococcota bacterium]|jgi:hypothetical protein
MIRELVRWLLVACSKPIPLPEGEAPRHNSTALASPADFESVDDRTEHSPALFTEMGKGLKHPHCANCRPRDNRSCQGMQQGIHEPPVWRGPDDQGVTGMKCRTCHQDANQDHARLAGAPHWQLAPIEMA